MSAVVGPAHAGIPSTALQLWNTSISRAIDLRPEKNNVHKEEYQVRFPSTKAQTKRFLDQNTRPTHLEDASAGHLGSVVR